MKLPSDARITHIENLTDFERRMAMRHRAIPRMLNLLDDPATPSWAKKLIHELLGRDPVDVANVLEVLYKAFSERT